MHVDLVTGCNDVHDHHCVNYDDGHDLVHGHGLVHDLDRDHGHGHVNAVFVDDIVLLLLHDRRNTDPNNDKNHGVDNSGKGVSLKNLMKKVKSSSD